MLKLHIGLAVSIFGTNFIVNNSNKFGFLQNSVKAMESVQIYKKSALDIYKKDKENYENINACYVNLPSAEYEPFNQCFYFDYCCFEENSRKVSLSILENPCSETTDGADFDKDNLDDNLKNFIKVVQPTDSENGELLKIINEIISLESGEESCDCCYGNGKSLYKEASNGKLDEYKKFLENLSVKKEDLSDKIDEVRYYNFNDEDKNKQLYAKVVELYKYLADLQLKLKKILLKEGMWYYEPLGSKDNSDDSVHNRNKQAKLIRSSYSYLEGWMRHFAAIGAFLEKIFSFGNLFYNRENGKEEKYLYFCCMLKRYINLRLNGGDVVENLSITQEGSDHLLLKMTEKGQEVCDNIFIPRCIEKEDFILNIVAAIKKVDVRYFLDRDSSLLNKRGDLIKLIAYQPIYVEVGGEMQNILDILGEQFLNQVAEAAIREREKELKVKEILQNAVNEELGKFLKGMYDVFYKSNDKKVEKDVEKEKKFITLYEMFLCLFNNFVCDGYMPMKFKDEIWKNVKRQLETEPENKNISEKEILSINYSCCIPSVEQLILGVLENARIVKKATESVQIDKKYVLDMYNKDKENYENINACYVNLPSAEYEPFNQCFYFDYNIFSYHYRFEEDNKKVSLYRLQEPCYGTTGGLCVREYNLVRDLEAFKNKEKLTDSENGELLKIIKEIISLESGGCCYGSSKLLCKKASNGKLDEYKKFLEDLSVKKEDSSVKINKMRYYNFNDTEKNIKLYAKVVELYKYLANLQLKLKKFLLEKGMWYTAPLSSLYTYNQEYYLCKLNIYIECWKRHIATTGAILEKLLGCKNLFYCKKNNKEAKYIYFYNTLHSYVELLLNGSVLQCVYIKSQKSLSNLRESLSTLDVMFFFDKKAWNNPIQPCNSHIQLPKGARLEGYFSLINEQKKFILNAVAAIIKVYVRYFLDRNSSLLNRRSDLIKLIADQPIYFYCDDYRNITESNKISYVLGEQFLNQVAEDAIEERKKELRVKEILQNAVNEEVDKFLKGIYKDVFDTKSGFSCLGEFVFYKSDDNKVEKDVKKEVEELRVADKAKKPDDIYKKIVITLEDKIWKNVKRQLETKPENKNISEEEILSINDSHCIPSARKLMIDALENAIKVININI